MKSQVIETPVNQGVGVVPIIKTLKKSKDCKMIKNPSI